MTAIETLLAGLFDYAGLYPPASLDLRSAANNYLGYAPRQTSPQPSGGSSSISTALDEFRSIVGDSLDDIST